MKNKLESNGRRITSDKIDENISQLEITEIFLTYCNLVNNEIQQFQRDSWGLYTYSKQIIRIIAWNFTKNINF